jgi:hypothetical protein
MNTLCVLFYTAYALGLMMLLLYQIIWRRKVQGLLNKNRNDLKELIVGVMWGTILKFAWKYIYINSIYS